MKNLYTIFFVVLLVVWGLGVWIVVRSGLQKAKMPSIKSGISKSEILDEQKRIADEQKAQREIMLEQQQFQIQQLKESLKAQKH